MTRQSRSAYYSVFLFRIDCIVMPPFYCDSTLKASKFRVFALSLRLCQPVEAMQKNRSMVEGVKQIAADALTRRLVTAFWQAWVVHCYRCSFVAFFFNLVCFFWFVFIFFLVFIFPFRLLRGSDIIRLNCVLRLPSAPQWFAMIGACVRFVFLLFSD